MKIKWEYNKLSGIYVIRNLINNKIYIGSSINIYQRLHKHRTQLIRNKHQNCVIQNSVNKYGIDNFECFVIEQCSEELLTNREQYYIDLLSPRLNIMKKVERIKLEESSKLKISNTLKAKYKSGEINVDFCKKKIYVYNLKNELLYVFNSQIEASIFLNISTSTIRRVADNTLIRFHDFVFSFKEIIFERMYRKYILIILETNTYYDFDYVEDCSDFLKIKKKALENPLKNKSIYLKKYKIFKSEKEVNLKEILEKYEEGIIN